MYYLPFQNATVLRIILLNVSLYCYYYYKAIHKVDLQST